MKAAVYLRVSTDRQDEANQEPECLRVCELRGWEPVIYRERESGAKARPVWAEVKEAARRAQVSAVVFWAIDRIGRNRVQAAHDVGELFRWGQKVVSVRESWLDTADGPMRDILVQFMAWVAEGERERLIERTRAGLARARAQGKRLGRPRAEIDARTHAAAADALNRGLSWRAAAKEVGTSATTLRRYMRAKYGGGAFGGNSA